MKIISTRGPKKREREKKKGEKKVNSFLVEFGGKGEGDVT